MDAWFNKLIYHSFTLEWSSLACILSYSIITSLNSDIMYFFNKVIAAIAHLLFLAHLKKYGYPINFYFQLLSIAPKASYYHIKRGFVIGIINILVFWIYLMNLNRHVKKSAISLLYLTTTTIIPKLWDW